MVIQTGKPRTPITAPSGTATSVYNAYDNTATSVDTVNTTATPPSNPANSGSTLSQQDIIDAINRLVAGTEMPNPLNNFWQLTYHWRFFIINDKDVYTRAGKPDKIADLYNKIDGFNPIIIAETGDTTYNIKSVEFQTICGPNNETKLLSAYGFTMTIVEPISMGFLEALKDAAAGQGIYNYNKCVYYIELSFKGYDEETGAINIDPLASSAKAGNGGYNLEASRWIWQVVIGDIDTNFDVTGGSYTMTLIPSNDQRFDDDIGLVAQPVLIAGNTIKDTLNSLGTSLTNAWISHYGNDLTSYDFNMHQIQNAPQGSASQVGDPNNFKMQPNNPTQSSQRQASMDSSGKVTGNFAPGTEVGDMITWILANNEKSQDLLIDRDGKTGAVDVSQTQTNSKMRKESILFRVEVDIEIVDYDIVGANYRKIVHYHIWPYYTQALLTGPVQRDNALSQTVQNDMVAALIQLGYIKKHYNYLYTGINTEVIDFKLHANFNWSALLPSFEGARAGYNQVDPGAKLNKATGTADGNKFEVPDLTGQTSTDLYALQAAAASQVSQANDNYNNLYKNVPPEVVAANQIPADKQTADQKKAIAAYNAQLSAAQNTSLQAGQFSVSLNKAIAQQVNRLNPSPAPNTQVNTTGGTTTPVIYAEDFILTDGTIANPQVTQFQYQWFNYAISFRQAYQASKRQSGTGMTGQWHRDKSVYGALIDQLFQPSFYFLANVELEIRGDPFWIGQSNLQRQVLVRGGQSAAGSQLAAVMTGLPNFYAGDQCFLLTFRFPITTGDNYAPVFKDADTFNGIYRITNVVSTFADGKFTQKLTGMILPLINLEAALNMKGAPPGSASSIGSGNSNASNAQTPSNNKPANPALTTSQQQQNARALSAALMAAAAAQGVNLTQANIDGFVANAYRESSMNPAVSNGYGLFQWSDPSRYNAFVAYTGGTSPSNATIEQQASFVVHELATTESKTLAALQQPQNASSASASAGVIDHLYERSANQTADMNKNLTFLPNLYGNGVGASS